MLPSSSDAPVPTAEHNWIPNTHIQVSLSQLTGAMYTQAQVYTNHRPKKNDWSNRADLDQPTHP